MPTVILEDRPDAIVVRLEWPDGRTEAYHSPREDTEAEVYTSDGMVSRGELTRSVTLHDQDVDEIVVQSVWLREGRLVKDSRWVISKRAACVAQAFAASMG